jgi:hypothetical protein
VSAFPKIRTAAVYVASDGPSDLARSRAVVLLKRLRACEAALAGGNGEIPAPAPGRLRGLVLAARDLAGPAWLAASGDDPDIAAFTALDATPVPPAPAELDEIISRVLWARFAPHGTARDGTGPDGPGSSG